MGKIGNLTTKPTLKLALLCGGPSLERGISMNSARSVMDHLTSENVQVVPFYFDQQLNAYALSPAQLYSNTPADFDFKLAQTAQPLGDIELEKELKSFDIVFPVMHGAFGEDGKIQEWLEERRIAFVGASSSSCRQSFDKFRANEYIKEFGFFTLPSCLLEDSERDQNHLAIKEFFDKHNISRAIVKPSAGGSSIGVFSVSTVEEALKASETIFDREMDTRVVVEPFVQGREFTVIVLESKYRLPVAILPTEIEADYADHQVFDFRKKYLPTRQVTYHCPPRFDNRLIERIQIQAEQLFVLHGMRDFTRFDGWVLDDGRIWFSDFNPISGMEQNSFLFQQSTRIGLSHRGVLEHIVARACERYEIEHPFIFESDEVESKDERKELPILFGGDSSERQVSLMSGTNVWLKMRNSKQFKPVPYLIDLNGGVWQVPYQLLLNHTVEEIVENCRAAALHEERIGRFESQAREKLGYKKPIDRREFGQPVSTSLEEIIENNDHVFLALHGGIGENGTLQSMLEKHEAIFNGPNADAAMLAMNKQFTADAINELSMDSVSSIKGFTLSMDELNESLSDSADIVWKNIIEETGGDAVIAKPVADGCSSGVVRLHDAGDLTRYISLSSVGGGFIPPNTFQDQPERIELALEAPSGIRFERYIQTDIVRVQNGKLRHSPISEMIEITIGVVQKDGVMRAMNPSLTVAESAVLSVEEKFQGGTGVNLTPPPPQILSDENRKKIKDNIEKLSKSLNLSGYCRIDAFANCINGDLLIIEINSLPALTPSTVLFQQALAEDIPIYPMELLELVANNK